MSDWWDRWMWMWREIGVRRCYLVLTPGVGYKPRKLGTWSDPPNAVVE